MAKLTAERASRIAKSHPCTQCGERSYKRVKVTPAPESHRKDLAIVWQAIMTCGVCGSESEIGIAEDGEIVY